METNKSDVIVQNMLKYISHIHENHSNNPIKFIVHLVITSGSDFLFSFGCVIALALGVVHNQKQEPITRACVFHTYPLSQLCPVSF